MLEASRSVMLQVDMSRFGQEPAGLSGRMINCGIRSAAALKGLQALVEELEDQLLFRSACLLRWSGQPRGEVFRNLQR